MPIATIDFAFKKYIIFEMNHQIFSKNYEIAQSTETRKPNYYCLNYENQFLVALLLVEYTCTQTKDELALKRNL
jgi:hypothetical protein